MNKTELNNGAILATIATGIDNKINATSDTLALIQELTDYEMLSNLFSALIMYTVTKQDVYLEHLSSDAWLIAQKNNDRYTGYLLAEINNKSVHNDTCLDNEIISLSEHNKEIASKLEQCNTAYELQTTIENIFNNL